MAAKPFLKAVHKRCNASTEPRRQGLVREPSRRYGRAGGRRTSLISHLYWSDAGREFRDTKLLAACCRAYNNWAAEYTSIAPKRLRWAAALPMQDVAEATAEAIRAAQLGCVSYYMRPNPVGGRTLWQRIIFRYGKKSKNSANRFRPTIPRRRRCHRLVIVWTRTSVAIFFRIHLRRWLRWLG